MGTYASAVSLASVDSAAGDVPAATEAFGAGR